MKKQWKLWKFGASVLGISLVLAVIFFTPATISYFVSADQITNQFPTDTVDIDVTETFEVPSRWDGSAYPKVVQVKNLGSTESLIRISLTPRWENADGTPFAGDTSFINLNWQNINVTPGWVNGNDGYYYYNAKVTSGGTTVPILSSVTFNVAQLDSNIAARYQGKKLIIDVQAEAVLAQEQAYETVWPQMAASGSATDTLLRTLIQMP